MTEHRCDRKPHVADCAVAPQGDGLPRNVVRHAGNGALHVGGLLCPDDEGVKVNVRAADAVHAGARGLGARRRGNHENNDAQDAAHLLERREAGLKLGQGAVDARGVVVDATLPQRAGLLALRPIGGYDDYGIQTSS